MEILHGFNHFLYLNRVWLGDNCNLRYNILYKKYVLITACQPNKMFLFLECFLHLDFKNCPDYFTHSEPLQSLSWVKTDYHGKTDHSQEEHGLFHIE